MFMLISYWYDDEVDEVELILEIILDDEGELDELYNVVNMNSNPEVILLQYELVEIDDIVYVIEVIDEIVHLID